MAALATPGRDVKPSRSRIEGYRNFATKLWNAARFAEMNRCDTTRDFDPSVVAETVNRWILTEAARAQAAVNDAIDQYRFADGATAIYRFVWNTYCDWYLELIKPILAGVDGDAKDETRAVAAFVRDHILKLLHPFMPFVTEELWERTAPASLSRSDLLILTDWPTLDFEDEDAAGEMNWVVELVSEIRSVRNEMNVPAGVQMPLSIVGSGGVAERVERHVAALSRLARVRDVDLVDAPVAGSVQIVAGDAIACLDLSSVIDIQAERDRLQRDVEKTDKEIGKIDAKLENEQFLEKAPREIIDEQRERRGDAVAHRDKLKAAIERLAG